MPELLLADALFLPTPLVVHPFVVSTLPAAGDPNRVGTRRTLPMTPYPKILMTPGMPAIVAGDPNDIAMGSHHNFLSRRRRRSHPDIQPDVELGRGRNGNCEDPGEE